MSLKLWLPLIGDINNQGLDLITSVSNAGAVLDGDGKIGKCYTSTDNTKKITMTWANQVSTIAGPGKKYSFACWAKPTLRSGWIVLLNNNTGFWYGLNNTRWVWNNADNGKLMAPYDTCGEEAWHHYVVTVDKTDYTNINYTFYLDGQLYTTKTSNGTNYSNYEPTGSTLTINPYYGYVQDVRIYDHCLSQKEVEELAKGLVLHYKLDPGPLEPNWLKTQTSLVSKILRRGTSNSFLDYNYRGIITACSDTLYTISFEAKGSVDGMQMDIYFRDSSGNSYAKTSVITLTTELTEYSLTISGSPANLQLFRVRCMGGTAGDFITIQKVRLFSDNIPGINVDILTDASGYNNNCNIEGYANPITSPRYSYGIYMNNTSSANRIETNNSFNLPTDAISVSFWVKCNKNTNQVIFAFPQLEFGFIGGDGFLSLTEAPGFNLTNFQNNDWNHIVAIRENNNYSLYVNGILAIQSGSSNYYSHNSEKLYLLNRSYNNNYGANASLSDFRIYSTILTQDQVQELYNTSMSIDKDGNIYARELVEI